MGAESAERRRWHLRGGPVKFFTGVSWVLTGARFVYLRHFGLIRIWIWPILITLAVFLGMTLGVLFWHDEILEVFWKRPDGGGIGGFGAGWLWWMVRAWLALVLFLIGLLAVYALSSLFAAPFNDMLSERVEQLRTGVAPPPFSWPRARANFALTMRLELSKQVVFWLVTVPTLLAAMLIPGFGPFLDLVLGYLLTVTFFAVDFTDWPLARRGHGVRARLRLLMAHKLQMAGFGTAVWLLLFIPGLGLLFLPAAVAGGTLMILDMEKEGQLGALRR